MNPHDRTAVKRTVRLFRNGRSQAVRIPKEWEFDGEEVILARAEDGTLTIEATSKKKSLLEVLASLEPLPEKDWMPEITDDDLLPLDDVEL